jgi:secreted trypsin-like serine protease
MNHNVTGLLVGIQLSLASSSLLSDQPALVATPSVENVRIMETMLEAAASERPVSVDATSPDYGPLQYRVSSASGSTFSATHLPMIVNLNPDEGIPDRIIGGERAQPADFPWQVALLNSTYGTLVCGGTHVGGGWIVTAAHCFLDEFGQELEKQDIQVLTGTISLISGGTRLMPSVGPIIHEQWDPANKANDIALLKVDSGDQIPTIEIPNITTEASLITPDRRLTVSGWGRVTDGGVISTRLLKVSVPVVSLDYCEDAYPGRIRICN